MPNNKIAILAEDKSREKDAVLLARDLQIPLAESGGGYNFLLVYTSDRLELRECTAHAPGPLFVDFSCKELNFRRRFGGGRKEPLARAVGLKHNRCPVVLDATAGLGRDSFILAGLGCRIYLRERSPVIAALLKDGITRGLRDKEIQPIMERMELTAGEARTFKTDQTAVDVVYLDPMYPEGAQKAQVKKEMQFLRKLVGRDSDTPELLAWALCVASNRVVVKRPRKALPISGPPPSFAIKEGRHRLDVYLN
ncbi:MAG: class I SAM-dependent methyltransferase [Desulfurivibrionaceae bacterium]